MTERIIYVPLDERPCNLLYPAEIGRIAGLEVAVPPRELLCRLKQPADVDAIWNWLEQEASCAQFAVLSLEMLVYGGLVPSRIHELDRDLALSRLERLRRLKGNHPHLQIHAFNLVLRCANYNSDNEDPPYWREYGLRISRYLYLGHRIQCGVAEAEELAEQERLGRELPASIMDNYRQRRGTNLAVNLAAVSLVEAGIITQLVIPKDDCAEYGIATQDQQAVLQRIEESALEDKVWIYPGADEVGCILVARTMNQLYGLKPRVQIRYSSTLGPTVTPRYEDRPLHEMIKWQVVSAGGLVVTEEDAADIILFVNAPGHTHQEAWEQEKDSLVNRNARNLIEFVAGLEDAIGRGKLCGVADVAYVNGGDRILGRMLVRRDLVLRLSAYGAWNTAANTVGSTLAQAMAENILWRQGRTSRGPDGRGTRLVIRKVIEDWAYQAQVMVTAGRRLYERGVDIFSLEPEEEKEITEEVHGLLTTFVAEQITPWINGVRAIYLENFSFPWHRLFETDFTVVIEPDSQGGNG